MQSKNKDEQTLYGVRELQNVKIQHAKYKSLHGLKEYGPTRLFGRAMLGQKCPTASNTKYKLGQRVPCHYLSHRLL